MTRIEFISEVKAGLVGYPEDEVAKSLNFYEESIDDRIEDGMSEEEAVKQLGSIYDIIQNIKLSMPISVLAKTRIKESKKKSSSKTLWFILAIAGFPVWLPLTIAFISVLLSIYVSIWAIIISIFACEIAFGISGAACLVYSFIHMVTVSYSGGVMMIGGALFLIGLCLILLKPTLSLTKLLVNSTGSFVKWVKKICIGKESR